MKDTIRLFAHGDHDHHHGGPERGIFTPTNVYLLATLFIAMGAFFWTLLTEGEDFLDGRTLDSFFDESIDSVDVITYALALNALGYVPGALSLLSRLLFRSK